MPEPTWHSVENLAGDSCEGGLHKLLRQKPSSLFSVGMEFSLNDIHDDENYVYGSGGQMPLAHIMFCHGSLTHICQLDIPHSQGILCMSGVLSPKSLLPG
jgi:hypothetical protein